MDWVRSGNFIEGRESPSLPGVTREEEEEGPGSLSMLFFYHLELGSGETLCHYLAPLTYRLVGEPLWQEEEQSLT
jgi:hypothetical protein